MFYFNFNINVPWKRKFKSYWVKDFGHISPNKRLEMQFMKDFYLIGIELDFEYIFKGRDHAGPEIAISLFGYTFRIHIYDIRHWDFEKDCWENSERKS